MRRPAMAARFSLSPAMRLSRFLPNGFTLALLCAMLLASLLPVHGTGATVFGWITNLAIALLFFLHGARLSRQTVLAGAAHWRLHLAVFSMTFVLFPVAGVAFKPLLEPLVTPSLYAGVLFLCFLPSTVQSAIAFTSMARGNVPAAVCSASASSLLGIFLTPLLAGLVLTSAGNAPVSFDAALKIVVQLLLPFALGQVLQPLVGAWALRRKKLLALVDQGSILMVVYTAFSAAVNQGLWTHTPVPALLALAAICTGLFVLAVAAVLAAGRYAGFGHADRMTLLFCGSNKSLATGIPIAQMLFTSHAVGAIVLPLMMYHQIQLFVCALLAQHYGNRSGDASPAPAPGTPA